MRLRIIALWLAALAGATGAGLPGAEMAHAKAVAFLQLGASTQPPRGYIELCRSRPDLCGSFAGRAAESSPVEGVGAAGRLDGFAGRPLGIVPAPWEMGNARRMTCHMIGFEALTPLCRVTRGLDLEPADRRVVFHPASLEFEPTDWLAWMGAALPRPWADRETGGLAPSAFDWVIPWPRLSSEMGLVPAGEQASARPGGASANWRHLLARVNARVNARVYQQSDLATYGVPEMWRPSGIAPGAVGDCEDLALEKRVELLAENFPAERLFLAVVYRGDVGLHTVLVARLDDGDVVLDSRVDFIAAWPSAGYNWVSIEVPGRPEEWREAV